VLPDLAIAHPHGVDGIEVDLAAGGGHSEKRPCVRAVIRLEGGHDLAVGRLPVDHRMEIRKRGPKRMIKVARAGLVRRPSGLRRVVEEIVGEELIEQLEITNALNFLGVAADHRLRDFQSNSAAIEQVLLPNVRDLGDGFHVRRALPSAQRRTVGPFIFLDSFGPVTFRAGESLDARPHPHIGLSTLTYLIEGEIVHRDSEGHVQTIHPGEVNLMTAGRGIVHSERSSPSVRAAGGTVFGFQSWIALPVAHEETEPGFQHLTAESLPRIEGDGATLRLLAGSPHGLRSPTPRLFRSL
jgi:hypothetical protein